MQTGEVFSNGDASFPCAVAAWATIDTHPTGLYAFTSASVDCSAIEAVGAGARSVGVRASGGRADMLIVPGGTAGPSRADSHFRGEIINDNTGALWLCVTNGTPGVWRKIAANETAGALHAISPVRVYDSRVPTPSPGALASGTNRLISVASARDLTTGAVTTAHVVPAGATAVFANLTIANTVSSGFLGVNPGGNTTLAASAINWSSSGQSLANGLLLTLDNNRQVTVIAGGGGSTDFVIDVSGYYL